MEEKVSEAALKYLQRIKKNRWDSEAWTCLLNEICTVKIDVSRKYYDQFFELFPSSWIFWKQYLHHEIESKSSRELVTSIWKRCLMSCVSVELWEYYLKYVESIGGLEESCFKLAIDHVGYDINATKIFLKYLTFLQINTNDVQKIRKEFHKALNTPMNNLDQIWNLYEKFENSNSSHQTKSILTERHKKYNETLKKYHEKKKHRKGLLLNMLAVPFNRENSSKLIEQKLIWKGLIECEKKNTQRLDSKIIKERVLFLFKQSFSCLRFFPEMWFECAIYLIECNDFETAKETYKLAIETLPNNLLIVFGYIDFLETQKENEEAIKLFEMLLNNNPKPIVYVNYLKFLERTKGIKYVRKHWINLIRDQRHKQNITYHVYVCLSNLEFERKEENHVVFARKIYKIGFNRFQNNPKFLMEYISFLEKTNDIQGLRSLYERVFQQVNEIKEKGFFEIFNKYLNFEYKYGDSNTIHHAEEKYFEFFPNLKYNTPMKSVVKKYQFLDLLPCDRKDVQFMDNININEEKKRIESLKPKKFLYTPSFENLVQVNPQQLQNLVKNPTASLEIMNDIDLSAVAKMLPILPQLKGEILPDLEVVMDTLLRGPLGTFENTETTITKIRERKRKRSEAFGKNDTSSQDIYASRRKKPKKNNNNSRKI